MPLALRYCLILKPNVFMCFFYHALKFFIITLRVEMSAYRD
jgi:hypothetical protein